MEHHYFLQDAQGAYFPINGPTMIGRDPACPIRLSDPEVSRNHALLWMERRTLYLRDENTKNGTYLNEGRIPTNQPIAVSAGSQVRVGQTIFTVVSLQPVPIQPPVVVPAPLPVPIPAPQRPSQLPLFLIIIIGSLCLGALVLAVVYLLLQLRSTQPTPLSFIGLPILIIAQCRNWQNYR